MKRWLLTSNRKVVEDKFDDICKQLNLDIASKKGSSFWLSALPIQKRAFIDAICFHYGWRPANLLTNCVCRKPFTVKHALSCSFGGFPTIRHSELRDVTGKLFFQVCTKVQVEPQLQPLSGESLSHHTSNSDDHARLDISARGFWSTSHEKAFIDLRVFNLLAKSHLNQTLPSCYHGYK